MRNWEVKSRSRECSSCGRPFVEEQSFHSLLDLASDTPERFDICERCWREEGSSRRRDRAAYWQSRFRGYRAPVEREKIKKNIVRHLLDRYIDSELPEHVNLCFVLALLEERKKNLVVRKVTSDKNGMRTVIYEHPADGKTYLIRDPGLTLSGANEVEDQVRALLAEEEQALSAAAGDEEENTASSGRSEKSGNKEKS